MMRIVRRIGTFLAALAVTAIAAGPSLAGMNDGGGFQAVTAPSQSTCAAAVHAAVTAILNGQAVDRNAVIDACRP